MDDPRRLTLWLCLLTAPALGCGKGSHTAYAADSKNPLKGASTLLVAVEEGPNSLDIQGVGTNRPSYGASWNVYDRLITFGKKTRPDGQVMYDYEKPEPELAERWEIDPGKSITFFLRKDATFHDGTPVTAQDVKWSFDRAVTIGGFPTFQMKAGSLEKPAQFEVVDDHTFRVKLVRNDKFTLPDLGVPVPAIYNSKLAKSHATPTDPWAQTWLKNNAAASGGYKVDKFEPGVQLQLRRFENWKSGPVPQLERVILRVVPSAATRRAMLERGDVDVLFDLPPRDVSELAAKGTFKVQGVPVENFMWFIDMNVKKPPFDKLEVRQAIAAAIPYDQIYGSACYGRGVPLYGGPSKTATTAEWPQPYPYKTDLAKAKQLLAAAGLSKGFSTTLYYNLGLSTWSEPIALMLQQNLRKLNIDVTLEKIPAANWRGEMGKKSMPFLINDMGGWLNYPDYFFFWNYHSQNAVFNTMSYQNPDMDKAIDAARFAESPELYASAVKTFITKAFDDTPRIPLFQSNVDVAMKPNIHGYQYWFHRQVDFRQLYKTVSAP
ncbi:MAG TPA: ABC transporter substrate-binding protein [Polyangiales bacterium]|nr:ABC transporter substrate-binding protein [Polyangiales bacterium]